MMAVPKSRTSNKKIRQRKAKWFTKANIQREHAPLLGRSVLSEGVGSFIYNPDEEDDDEDDDDDDEYDEGESAWRGQVDDTTISALHRDVSGMLLQLGRSTGTRDQQRMGFSRPPVRPPYRPPARVGRAHMGP